ncbi:MAG TPA: response regulator transcription factor [Chloroflexota bacterium]|jgi:DNA-binding NarL/FixJ family response regulator|nr:response regulator transcription factor [Chloroflexota bacterium]
MADTPKIRVALVVGGGSPVLHVGVFTALQADPRLQLIEYLIDPLHGALPVIEEAIDVLALLTDAALPDALREADRLQPANTATPRLLLRHHVDADDIAVAVHAGLRGYAILASLLPDDLACGLIMLARYGTWLCPQTTRLLLALVRNDVVAAPVQLPARLPVGRSILSERELDVLRHGATGLSETAIAERLSLAPNTVKTYWRRICEKLDVTVRSEAIIRGIQLGLIQDRRRRGSEDLRHGPPPLAAVGDA